MNNSLFANHLFKLGLNITCITNYVTDQNFYDANILKAPYHEWKHLKNSRQKIDELKEYDWDNSVGLGTVAGFDNLHVLDIDGCSNYDFIKDLLILLELPSNYEWVVKSGSLDGYHIYFYSDVYEKLDKNQVASSYSPSLENTGLFEKIEFLWSTHVVLPYSLHKSGSQYIFTNCKFPNQKPLFIDIDRFNIIETLFLNIPEMRKKSVYFFESIENHRNIQNPKRKDEIFNLSSIKENLFFVFDIETDGLICNDNYPNIVQVAWIIMDINGIVYKKMTELVRTNFNEDSKAFEVNKLNPEVINKIGKNPSEVYRDITYDLNHCKFITAHNLEFDLSILKNEFNKYQIEYDFNHLTEFCSMRDWKKPVLENKDKFLKLTELYQELFNHEVKQFHNANSDVSILAKCVKELLYQGKLSHLKHYEK